MSEVSAHSDPPTEMSKAQPVILVNKPEVALSEPTSASSVKKKAEPVAAPPPKGVGVMFMMFTLIGTRLAAGVVGVPISTLTVGYVFALCIQICLIPIGMLSVNFLLTVRDLTKRSSQSDIGFY